MKQVIFEPKKSSSIGIVLNTAVRHLDGVMSNLRGNCYSDQEDHTPEHNGGYELPEMSLDLC